MMKTIKILVGITITWFWLSLILSFETPTPNPVGTCPEYYCGIKPLKPIPPIGCQKVDWICVCSLVDGGCADCHWELYCVE